MTKKKDTQADVQAAIDKEEFDKETKDQRPDLSGFDQISVKIWKPEAGEFMTGVYDGKLLFEDESKKGSGDVYIHYLIDSETKNRISFLPGTVFDKTITDAKVKSGDFLYVAYEGQTTTKDDNPVNLWDVRIKRS